MRRIVTVPVALVSGLVLLAGCDPRAKRPAPEPISPSTVATNVKQLCDFFATRPLEVLGTPTAEGNVSLLSDQPGVPSDLRIVARGYYDGGYGGKPDTAERKRVQEQRYKVVLDTCTAAGTGWTRP